MVRTQIQLTEEQAEALKKLAKVQDVSMAELIRQSVQDYLKKKVVISPDEQRKRALAIAGKFSSKGKGDISINHDQYLAQGIYDGLR